MRQLKPLKRGNIQITYIPILPPNPDRICPVIELTKEQFKDQYIPFNAPELSGDEIRKLHEESKADMEALDRRINEISNEFGRKILKAIQEAEANPQPPWMY